MTYFFTILLYCASTTTTVHWWQHKRPYPHLRHVPDLTDAVPVCARPGVWCHRTAYLGVWASLHAQGGGRGCSCAMSERGHVRHESAHMLAGKTPHGYECNNCCPHLALCVAQRRLVPDSNQHEHCSYHDVVSGQDDPSRSRHAITTNGKPRRREKITVVRNKILLARTCLEALC